MTVKLQLHNLYGRTNQNDLLADELFINELTQRGLFGEIQEICRTHGVLVIEIRKKTYFHHIQRAKGEVIDLLRNKYNWSFGAIGKLLHLTASDIIKRVK